MKQDVPLGDEIADWATGVKERIAELPTANEGSIQLDSNTFDELATALDLLLDTSRAQLASSGQPDCAPASLGRQAGDCSDSSGPSILDSWDRAFAHWQAQVAIAYSDSATEQLSEQLNTAASLVLQLETRETALLSRQTKLDEQQSQLEAQLANLLAREARLERQRKTVASDLRRRKAEGLLEVAQARQDALASANTESQQALVKSHEAILAEIEQERESHAATKELLATKADDCSTAQELLEELNNRPETSSANPELLEKIEELRQHNTRLVSQHQEQLARSEAEADAENMRLLQKIGEIGEQLEQQTRQLAKTETLQEQLTEAQASLAELQSQAAENSADPSEAEARVGRELEAALERIRELESSSPEPASQGDSEELAQQLTGALAEIEELRQRNAELASQTTAAGAKPHLNFNQESLSWEERKKLILQQLDYEDHDPESAEDLAATKVEIEMVLKTTQAEIERRDKEIAELQSIVEQQSNTSQGVAIGAAAIAQMFESDDLIKEEREKLKEIQKEWEQKVRQAEIDISMERAKLARERSQIEAKVSDLEARLPPASAAKEPAPGGSGGGRTRKWLEHLGLKEDPEA